MAVYSGSERSRAGTAVPMVMLRDFARARSVGCGDDGACCDCDGSPKDRLIRERTAVSAVTRTVPSECAAEAIGICQIPRCILRRVVLLHEKHFKRIPIVNFC